MLNLIASVSLIGVGVFAVIALGIFAPPPPAKAAGPDGYEYTQRVCHEYGQQPRWYVVRDEVGVNNWSSSGGWAIVLEGAAHLVTYYERLRTSWQISEETLTDPNNVHYHYPVEVGDGRTAYVRALDDFDPQIAIIDRNGDGVISASDGFDGTKYLAIEVVERTGYSGGLYTRWANMAWCY